MESVNGFHPTGGAMTTRKKISISLSEHTIQVIDSEAMRNNITRQDLVEDMILASTKLFSEPDSHNVLSIQAQTLEMIKSKIDKLHCDSEVSFKKLFEREEWNELSDVQKRNYGKQFKKLVETGQVYGMTLGRKKSNNEQQYQMNLFKFIQLCEQGEFDLSFEQCQELYRDLTQKGIDVIPDEMLIDVEGLVSSALANNAVEEDTVRDKLDRFLVSLRERIERLP